MGIKGVVYSKYYVNILTCSSNFKHLSSKHESRMIDERLKRSCFVMAAGI